MTSDPSRTILLAGASRGLGLGLARAFAAARWTVIATVRQTQGATELQALAEESGGRVTVETLDVAEPASIGALADRLQGRRIDVLFVVAGRMGQRDVPLQDLPAATIAQEFVTNSTGPVALAERLLGTMPPDGTVVFMTSLLGSIASNAGGGLDLYRASKAALNMLAVNFAIRHKGRPVLLMHPGWVRTDMGGPNATLDVETSVRGMMAQVVQSRKPGIAYIDYQGNSLPW